MLLLLPFESPHRCNLLRRQWCRFGCDTVFLFVFSMTQTGTRRFCLPAFNRRIFFAAGLFFDMFEHPSYNRRIDASLRLLDRLVRIRFNCSSLTGMEIFCCSCRETNCRFSRSAFWPSTREMLVNLPRASEVRMVFIAISSACCSCACACDSTSAAACCRACSSSCCWSSS